jgi:hypothetical protein
MTVSAFRKRKAVARIVLSKVNASRRASLRRGNLIPQRQLPTRLPLMSNHPLSY